MDIPKHINSKQLAKDGGYKYFYGTPCKYGHPGLRYVGGHCVECRKIKNNSKEAKQKKIEYRKSEKGRATIRAYNVKYYHEDRDNQIKRSSEYAKKYPEKRLALQRKYKEKRYEYTKKWREENKSKCRAHELNRKTRIKYNGGKHTGEQILNLLILQKFKCLNCGVGICEKTMQRDHIVPLVLGGSNDIKNIQLLCHSCNSSKRAKHPIDWAQQNGRLL